jgi:hypothetical protein
MGWYLSTKPDQAHPVVTPWWQQWRLIKQVPMLQQLLAVASLSACIGDTKDMPAYALRMDGRSTK